MTRAPLFALENATLRHASGTVFQGLDIDFAEGDRVALVGRNGAGKTSLLALLAGDAELSVGRYVRRRGMRVGYVSQFLPGSEARKTVRQAVVESLAGQDLPLPARQWAECLADQYDFPIEWLDRPFSELSGGWQNRAVLLRELARDPHVLLLDEPTNHMDVEGIEAFEALLADRVSCAVLMVCHDLDVLDRVCGTTWFLREGRIEKMALPCSTARLALEGMDAAREERRRVREKEIDRVRSAAKSLALWGKNYGNEKFSRRAKSMEKRVDRMEGELQAVVRESHGKIELAHGVVDAKTLVRMEARSFSTPDRRVLFSAQGFVLRPGERVVLLGPNGAGKSTFVRALVEAYRSEAAGVTFNPRVRLGYYDQGLEEVASRSDHSLFRFVRDASDDLGDQALRNALVDAGFPFDEHAKRLSVCSGGEKARVLLLALRLSGPNMLVLDEPTNHIDIYGVEALARDLVDKGTPAVIVTHDRAFARAVGTRYLRLHEGRLVEAEGA